jgi:hypothetical protein
MSVGRNRKLLATHPATAETTSGKRSVMFSFSNSHRGQSNLRVRNLAPNGHDIRMTGEPSSCRKRATLAHSGQWQRFVYGTRLTVNPAVLCLTANPTRLSPVDASNVTPARVSITNTGGGSLTFTGLATNLSRGSPPAREPHPPRCDRRVIQRSERED